MENTQNVVQEILDVNAPKNGVNTVLTLAIATKLFSETYAGLSTEELNLLKLNPDFVVGACNLVENLFDKKKHKTNKKELATNILITCLKQKNLGYHHDEIKHLDVVIESCHSNNRIKKISLKKRLGKKTLNFFSSLLK